MKKKLITYLLIPLLISLVGVILLLYKIADQYMWTDEVFSFEAAKMIIQKGQALYDSGLYYWRSSIYHHLLAWSMQIFGENEFGSRILNIPFLIGTSLILYFTQLRKNWKLGLITSLIYLSTNFTIALSRETRMYAMAQCIFLLLILCFYKVSLILEEYFERKRTLKTLFTWKNILMISLTGIIAYLAYNTQNISGIFILVVIAYYIWLSILKRNWIYVLLSLSLTVVLFGGIYWKYDTLNILEWFKSLSPEWADTVVPTYYIVITARNLPWIAISIPPILFFIFKKRQGYSYLVSLIAVYTIFLSLQTAQHERYWQLIIPILLLTSVSAIWEFTKILTKRTKIFFLICSTALIVIPQTFLCVKELTEIDTYTEHSIYQYKKFQFNDVFSYLDNNLVDGKYLIADYHSAMTLIEKGYTVDSILVNADRMVEGTNQDVYFNTPYLEYSEANINAISNAVIIIRDLESFDNFDKYMNSTVEEFAKPKIFIK